MSFDQLPLFAEYPSVKVERSARRRKTVQGHVRDGVLHVVVPEHISREEERHWVREMVNAHQERTISTDDELAARMVELARKYRLPIPTNIRWIRNQKSKWAYCDLDTQTISICERVKAFPEWVRDYVIIHELAHLIEPRHNTEFWDLVHRFKKAERARGYLDAKSEDDGSEL